MPELPTIRPLFAARATPVLIAAALAALALAAPAAALPPGVHMDPGSPAGKEYAFPLDVARGQAVGHGSVVQGVAQPLFGAGITPAVATRPRAHAGTTLPQVAGPKSGAAGGAGTLRESGKPAGNHGPPVSRAALARLAHSSSPVGDVALLVAPILIVGFALGAGLVRLGRHGS